MRAGRFRLRRQRGDALGVLRPFERVGIAEAAALGEERAQQHRIALGGGGLDRRRGRGRRASVAQRLDLGQPLVIVAHGAAIPRLQLRVRGGAERLARSGPDPRCGRRRATAARGAARARARGRSRGSCRRRRRPGSASPSVPGASRRKRSIRPPIASMSLIGSPSSQCPCAGEAATAAVQRSGSRRRLSGWSPAEVNSVTDHVPLSPGSVRKEIVPASESSGAMIAGWVPRKKRE